MEKKTAKSFMGCGICLGILFITVGGIMMAAAPGEEIPIWFGITLCKTGDGSYVSYDASSTCPTASCPKTSSSLCSSADASSQTFEIDESLVNVDASYNPVIMRTENDASVDMSIQDNTGTIIYTSDADTPLGRRLLEFEGFDDEEEESESEEPDTGFLATMRHLLKGSSRSSSSSSGGSRSRARSGSASRWGSTTSTKSKIKTTKYGFSGRNAVPAATGVVVYRRGPKPGGVLYTTNYETQDAHPSCTDKKRGCEYYLPKALVRDEILKKKDGKDFKISMKTPKFPLTLIITNATVVSKYSGPTRRMLANTGDPEVYATLFSQDPSPVGNVGGILLGVGCALLFVACCVGQILIKRAD